MHQCTQRTINAFYVDCNDSRDAWHMFADFRGRLTCLFPTQLRPLMRRFFLVFLGCEHGNLGVV